MLLLSSKQVPIEFSGNPTKFKKYHKIKIKSALKFCKVNAALSFASQDLNYMPVKQLITLLKLVKPSMKSISKKCKLDLCVRPNTLLTKKPKDIRMGRGKGAPTERVALVGASQLFKLYRLTPPQAKLIYEKCVPKMFHSKFFNYNKW